MEDLEEVEVVVVIEEDSEVVVEVAIEEDSVEGEVVVAIEEDLEVAVEVVIEEGVGVVVVGEEVISLSFVISF